MIDGMPDNPFAHYSPAKAEKLLALAEEICEGEVDAAAHFAVCLIGLATRLDIAVTMLEYVDIQAQQAEAENESPRH
tara:strand:+ start:842 stop:1072 length:231 start_codon:yes stop_codon:yes gene_type:complete